MFRAVIIMLLVPVIIFLPMCASSRHSSEDYSPQSNFNLQFIFDCGPGMECGCFFALFRDRMFYCIKHPFPRSKPHLVDVISGEISVETFKTIKDILANMRAFDIVTDAVFEPDESVTTMKLRNGEYYNRVSYKCDDVRIASLYKRIDSIRKSGKSLTEPEALIALKKMVSLGESAKNYWVPATLLEIGSAESKSLLRELVESQSIPPEYGRLLNDSKK